MKSGLRLELDSGKTGPVQLTKSKEVMIIKFLNHLDTNIPPCNRLLYHYHLTVYLPANSLRDAIIFCIQPESFLTQYVYKYLEGKTPLTKEVINLFYNLRPRLKNFGLLEG